MSARVIIATIAALSSISSISPVVAQDSDATFFDTVKPKAGYTQDSANNTFYAGIQVVPSEAKNQTQLKAACHENIKVCATACKGNVGKQNGACGNTNVTLATTCTCKDGKVPKDWPQYASGMVEFICDLSKADCQAHLADVASAHGSDDEEKCSYKCPSKAADKEDDDDTDDDDSSNDDGTGSTESSTDNSTLTSNAYGTTQQMVFLSYGVSIATAALFGFML